MTSWENLLLNFFPQILTDKITDLPAAGGLAQILITFLWVIA